MLLRSSHIPNAELRAQAHIANIRAPSHRGHHRHAHPEFILIGAIGLQALPQLVLNSHVAGLIGSRGLAGNWEWWSFGLAHVAMAVVFAPLWRRSGVLTDAAFTELRYGGPAAAWLRGIKAFLLALPVNCIGIGYAFLALRKVVEALGIVSGSPAAFGVPDTLWLLAVVALMVLAYTVAGGLWAVVVTDLVQLVLALLGALAVAVAALHAAGGMGGLLGQLEGMNRPELLSLVPWTIEDGGVHWLEGAGISVPMFLAYIAVQWWSFRRSDGGGEFIQRMLATRDEQQARLAGWVHCFAGELLCCSSRSI